MAKKDKGKQPARGKQSTQKNKDSERVNEELVQTPAEHSKDIENVDQDKGVSGGVDVDRWAEEEAEEQASKVTTQLRELMLQGIE